MYVIKNLCDLRNEDMKYAGSKSVSLGIMIGSGVPVPAGFVIGRDVFQSAIEEAGARRAIEAVMRSVNFNDIGGTERASHKIQNLVIGISIPGDVKKDILQFFSGLPDKNFAVRSSAIPEDGGEFSYAGVYGSFLNVSEDNLFESILRCWASSFSVIALSRIRNASSDISKYAMAVIVQSEIIGDVSGVSFSVDPVSADPNYVYVEASHIPSAVTSGAVTPAGFRINKSTGEFSFNVRGAQNSEARRTLLTDDDVTYILSLTLRIEKIFGFPVDVEWIKKENKFFVVQARPITALDRTVNKKLPPIASINTYSGLAGIIENEGPFTKYSTFPRTSVVFFEAMSRAYFNNPYFDGVVKDNMPNQISFMGELYEAWQNREKRMIIKFDEEALRISSDTLAYLFQAEHEITGLINKTVIPRSDPESSIELLEKISAITVGLYQRLAFFTDECFVSNDDEILKNLRQTRMEATRFVMRYLAPAYREIMSAISSAYGVASPLIYNLTLEEIISGAASQNFLNDIIENRPICCLAYRNNFVIVCEEPALEIIRQLYTQDLGIPQAKAALVNRFFSGVSVSKGKARGKVLKIEARDYFNQAAADRFKNEDGFVVVSQMTRPELALYLGKAKAFVTDEGGATCHAAILAREMKKPCIVGTGIATRVLNDGDIVEVDADLGIVSIK